MPDSATATVNACPFCHSQHQTTVCENGLYFVLCGDCGARGPALSTGSEALSHWLRGSSDARLVRELVDSSPSMVMIKDREGRFLLANQALATLFNTTVAELVGRTDAELENDPALLEFYRSAADEVFATGKPQLLEESSVNSRSGDVHHYYTLKKLIRFGPDDIPAALIIATDITALKRANKEIAAREKRYLEAMTASGEGIWELDIRDNLIAHNSHLPEIYGFDPSFYEVSSSFLFDRIHPEDKAWVYDEFIHFLEGDGDYESQHRVLRDDGSVIWIRSRGRVVERDEEGRPLRVIGSTRDISQRKRAEANLEEARRELEQANDQLEDLVEQRTSELVQLNLELQNLARRDALTGLANRLAADEHLMQEFARFRRQQQPYMVLLADVDHFKKVNDTLGHAMGDRALMHVARLLKDNLRETDVVARYGGEEFLMLVHTQNLAAARQLAEGIRRLVEVTPVTAGLSLTISIGLAEVLASDSDASEALKRADDQLYVAKAAGRNCVRVVGDTPS